jgi:hypothetical protein
VLDSYRFAPLPFFNRGGSLMVHLHLAHGLLALSGYLVSLSIVIYGVRHPRKWHILAHTLLVLGASCAVAASLAAN